MMGVYIKGMEIPKGDSMIVVIRPDGMIEDVMGCYVGKAVPVPPHGDLIDRRVAYDKIAEQEGGNYVDMDAVDSGLEATPVIIPAEEGE